MINTQCDFCERPSKVGFQILTKRMPMQDTLLNEFGNYRLDVTLKSGYRPYETTPEICEICVATALVREVVKRHGQEVARDIMSELTVALRKRKKS
jgi:hypothetical protein